MDIGIQLIKNRWREKHAKTSVTNEAPSDTGHTNNNMIIINNE